MYAFMVAACFLCERPFSSNPNRVPSIKDKNGIRQPICKSCHDRANALRVSRGLEPWPDPLPGAYEPAPEEEIIWNDDNT